MNVKKSRWEREPTKIGGREYYHADYYITKYDISEEQLREHRKNGLPFVKQGRGIFMNEDDFHAYFAGKIGRESKPDGRSAPRDPNAPPRRAAETRPEIIRALKKCQSVMNTKRTRAITFPEISAYRENYTVFRTEVGYRKKALREGKIGVDEFTHWLEEQRRKII